MIPQWVLSLPRRSMEEALSAIERRRQSAERLAKPPDGSSKLSAEMRENLAYRRGYYKGLAEAIEEFEKHTIKVSAAKQRQKETA